MQQGVKWKWKEEGKDLSLEVSIVPLSFLFFFLLLRTSLYRDSMKNVGRIEGGEEKRERPEGTGVTWSGGASLLGLKTQQAIKRN